MENSTRFLKNMSYLKCHSDKTVLSFKNLYSKMASLECGNTVFRQVSVND